MLEELKVLKEDIKALSIVAFEKQMENQPVLKNYGKRGFENAVQGSTYLLQIFFAALEHDSFILLKKYIEWVKSFLQKIQLPPKSLYFYLDSLQAILKGKVKDEELQSTVDEYITRAKELLEEEVEIKTFIENSNPYINQLLLYKDLVFKNKKNEAKEMIAGLIAGGIPIKDIYLHIFQPFQYEVGRLWQLGFINVAQEHYYTATTQFIMSNLYDYIFSGKKNEYGVVAACVEGELHEVGIRMVTDFLENEGFNTCYLGANSPISDTLDILAESKSHILALSATMIFNIPKVASLIEQIKKREELNHIKIIVGGYPFGVDGSLWKKIRADSCASSLETITATVYNMLTLS